MSKAATVVPVRTRETTAAYDRRARQIIARIDHEVQASEQRPLCPEDLAIWLATMAASLAPASWRQYKAVLVAHAETMVEINARWQPILDRLTALRWSSADNKPVERRLLRTSARKLKAASTDRLEQLRARLAMHDPKSNAFLTATWTTGLRPIEWAGAHLDSVSDRWRLRVRNAKATNGRAHGESRTLWFDAINFQLVMAIRQPIDAFKEAATRNEVTALQEQIERAFRTANDALWPLRKKSITPYTLRHQFAARVKLAYRSEEVAALMGHANDITLLTHYARRSRSKSGNIGPPLPKPDPVEVARVKLARSAGLERLDRIKSKQLTTADPQGDPAVEGTREVARGICTAGISGVSA